MNTSLPASELTRWMGTALTEVVETLLGGSVTNSTQVPIPPTPTALVAEIALIGATSQGAVRLILPDAFVRSAAAALLGGSEADPRSEAQLKDFGGEVANMVAGRLASELRRVGFPCTLGTPSVSRGWVAPSETIVTGEWLCQGFPLRLEFSSPLPPA
ncbi:MAG: chemotaxis protein CheX [Verrucomicrobia bacterium]|nr:chemotaxis protein CheX [Verrucomicrobiota bacterium]